MKQFVRRFVLLFLAVICLPVVVFAVSDGGEENLVPDEPGTESVPSGEEDSPPEEETVSLYRTETDEVVELSWSDYVKGVVSAEIPMTYEIEAIKAQAVAAHTYALRLRESGGEDPSLKGADFSDDPSRHQAYFDKEEFDRLYGAKAEEYRKKLDTAVDAVMDFILLYEEEPIAAAFHAASSGKTESAQVVWGGAVDYLVPVESGGDVSSPSYHDEKALTFSEITEKLTAAYPDFAPPTAHETLFSEEKRSASGTVTEVKVGNLTLSGAQLRSVFSLASANITFSYEKNSDSWSFETKGLGHGVGMSQYGANEMAKAGKNFNDILLHYYTGVTLSALSDD